MRRVLVPVLLLALSGCTSRKDWSVRAGNAAASRHDLEGARAAFARAAELSPDDAQVRSLLGSALAATGHQAEARAEWEKALALDPSQEEAQLGLSRLAVEAGEPDRALALLKGSAQVEARVIRARALLLRAGPGDALAVSKDLEGLDRPDAIFLKGSALLMERHLVDAQAAFEFIDRRAPLYSRYGLARLAAAQGRSTDALLHLSAARSAAGASWSPAAVIADPAFSFLDASPDFQALTTK